jgi:hypothetical protein
MSGEIYKQLPLMMQALGAIEETHKHQQGWAYRGKADFLNAIHPVLIAHSCSMVPEVLEEQLMPIMVKVKDGEKAAMYARVKLAVNLFASDGSFVRAVAIGDGQDFEDSCATNAYDRAMRSALEWLFCVPTKAPRANALRGQVKTETASLKLPAAVAPVAEKAGGEMSEEEKDRAFNVYARTLKREGHAARIKAECRNRQTGKVDWVRAYAELDGFAQDTVRA